MGLALAWACLGLVLCSGQLLPAQAAEAFPGLEEWNNKTILPSLRALKDDQWVLLELYAHWCPACQKFQPIYQDLAAHFQKDPGLVVARVDCAEYKDVCAKYEVRGYPTLLLGRAGKVAAHDAAALTKIAAVRILDNIVKELKGVMDASKEASALGRKAGGEGAGQGSEALRILPAPATASLNDVEGATMESWRVVTDAPAVLTGADARQALADWLALLARTHPSLLCQAGAAAISTQLDTLWPGDQEEPLPGLLQLDMCPGSEFKAYQTCGSAAGAKGDGFTCGLWQLLHTTSVRIADAPRAGANWLVAVRGFVRHFFLCSECSDHFVKMTTDAAAARVASRRDAVLWLWRAHNRASLRLAVEEDGGGGRRHEQWPTSLLCTRCKVEDSDPTEGWVEEEVFAFLMTYFGAQGAAQTPQTSSRSVQLGKAGAGNGWGAAALIFLAVAVALAAVTKGVAQYSPVKVRAF
ncbi:hypothetical protein ACKKBG_A12395 [Auxenochlorella protothecoides x Auxenochlorella symbiontica]